MNQKQTALITGSTSGIGLAIAIAFAKKGFNLIFNGLEKNGSEIAEQIASTHKIEYIFSPADMVHPDQLREMATLAASTFGNIDILVNNAGIQHVSPIESFPEEKWNEIIAVNLNAAFHLTKAVWPGMKAKKSGRIINIASAHGLFASEYKSAYVAAKHGLIGLTKTAALEGAATGITCNAICPGYVKTSLVEKQIIDQSNSLNMTKEDVIKKVILAKQAIKEFIPVETIAELCLFLASENASHITGTAIPIDGGWSAQ